VRAQELFCALTGRYSVTLQQQSDCVPLRLVGSTTTTDSEKGSFSPGVKDSLAPRSGGSNHALKGRSFLS
jgi:hypothetical protein